MARRNRAKRHFTAVLVAGLGLLASVAWARCPAACRVSVGAAHHRCRAACPPGAAGKDCRAACRAERRTENATCRAALSATAPSCGLTDLYVATSNGGAFATEATLTRRRGSVSEPFVRITDAVARARAERMFGAVPSEEEIRIHVAPGRYVGSYDAAQLQGHAEYEVLPIILNVPRLALLGSTVLFRDGQGLPTATDSATEAILEPDNPGKFSGQARSLFLVTRTADGAVGDGVTVDGFVIDNRTEGPYPNFLVLVDRVSDFRISNNLIQHGGFGVITQFASGTIEGNLLTHNGECGAAANGGSNAQPATVLIHANRVAGNGQYGIMGLAQANLLPIDRGGNTLELEPQQTTFDRNNPEDLQNIPDTLAVTVSGNDISDFRVLGVLLFAVLKRVAVGDTQIGLVDCSGSPGQQILGYQTQDDTQPLTSVLTANVLGNTITGNGSPEGFCAFWGMRCQWGVSMETHFGCRNDPRAVVITFAGRFEGNSFGGDLRGPALFTFNAWSNFPLLPGVDQTRVYARDSIYQVTDGDGELVGFDYDNPVTDPVSGAVLDNTLRVNGVEVPHGKSFP